jgi:hypothetical protein
MRTASGFQRLKAFTGPPDQERQERQWQYPIASGAPVTSTVTAPQKQFPTCFIGFSIDAGSISDVGRPRALLTVDAWRKAKTTPICARE